MSIRCDTSSLIAGSIVCGVPGLGIMGSVILATTGEGGSGPGILSNDVEPGDENKEFRGLVTDFPDTGTFVINENGTFTFTGASAASFQYQLYVDGVAIGSPVAVALYGELAAVEVDASGTGAVAFAGTGAVSATVLPVIQVAAGGTGSVAYTGTGNASVTVVPVVLVDASGIGAVTYSGVGAVSVTVADPELPVIELSAEGTGAVVFAGIGEVAADPIIQVAAAPSGSVAFEGTGAVQVEVAANTVEVVASPTGLIAFEGIGSVSADILETILANAAGFGSVTFTGTGNILIGDELPPLTNAEMRELFERVIALEAQLARVGRNTDLIPALL